MIFSTLNAIQKFKSSRNATRILKCIFYYQIKNKYNYGSRVTSFNNNFASIKKIANRALASNLSVLFPWHGFPSLRPSEIHRCWVCYRAEKKSNRTSYNGMLVPSRYLQVRLDFCQEKAVSIERSARGVIARSGKKIALFFLRPFS